LGGSRPHAPLPGARRGAGDLLVAAVGTAVSSALRLVRADFYPLGGDRAPPAVQAVACVALILFMASPALMVATFVVAQQGPRQLAPVLALAALAAAPAAGVVVKAGRDRSDQNVRS